MFYRMFALFKITIVMIICCCVGTFREDGIPRTPVLQTTVGWLYCISSLLPSLCCQVTTTLHAFLFHFVIWGNSATLTHVLQYFSQQIAVWCTYILCVIPIFVVLFQLEVVLFFVLWIRPFICTLLILKQTKPSSAY